MVRKDCFLLEWHSHTIPASANNKPEYCVFLFRVRDTGIQNGKTNENDERIFSTGEIRVLEQHRKPIRPSRAKKNKPEVLSPKTTSTLWQT